MALQPELGDPLPNNDPYVRLQLLHPSPILFFQLIKTKGHQRPAPYMERHCRLG